ncbi:hypothetical protein J2Y58_004048 [Sphingomonas sp. BE138]|uniref:hypothetical protein n=1 Tax=Sphingomonas sp. BE138 TaxID=2817845 RepID=UPI0028551E4D|nr:hypothetical protein [Sphingomonas sp. BE138]MDR6790665.1 hypothetical protein [Sphingomonas sp. BE138]
MHRSAADSACAAGIVAFAVVNLTFGSFALQYQPMPVSLAKLSWLSIASALVMVSAGSAMAWPRTTRIAAMAVACWLATWVVALHLPTIITHPASFGRLLPASEVVAMAVGPALIATTGRGAEPMTRIWLCLFAAAQFVFGLCHFLYLDITSSMVPGWLPGRAAWAVVTGVAHLAAGTAMAFRIRLRPIGGLLAVMYLAFALLVCAPLVAATPDRHLPWLMLTITSCCAASAFKVSTLDYPFRADIAAVASRSHDA